MNGANKKINKQRDKRNESFVWTLKIGNQFKLTTDLIKGL